MTVDEVTGRTVMERSVHQNGKAETIVAWVQ